MFSKLKAKDIVTYLFVVLLSILGGISLVLCDVVRDVDIIKSWSALRETGALNELIDYTVRIVIPLLVFCTVGYFIGKKTSNVLDGYRNKKLNLVFWILLVVGSFVLPIVYFEFQTRLGNYSLYAFNIYRFIKAIIYDGIVEELIFNYCFTSLICFSLVKVFCKKTNKLNKKYLIIGCVFSALFLFSFQLNSLATLYNVTIGLLVWAVSQYLIMDCIYVYVYVKYGLRYSILVHILFSFMLVGFCPYFLVAI